MQRNFIVSTPECILRFTNINHLCPYQPSALSLTMDEQAPKEPNLGDHYATLSIPQYAPLAQIKTAYRKMVLTYHPDKTAPGQTVDASDFRRVSAIPPSAQLCSKVSNRCKKRMRLFEMSQSVRTTIDSIGTYKTSGRGTVKL